MSLKERRRERLYCSFYTFGPFFRGTPLPLQERIENGENPPFAFYYNILRVERCRFEVTNAQAGTNFPVAVRVFPLSKWMGSIGGSR